MNLAVSDITFAVFVAPNHILKKTFTHPEGTGGTELCRILTKGNVAWLGAASSSLTLVAIAVERYYTVMGPLGSKGKLSKKKVKVSKQKKKKTDQNDLRRRIKSVPAAFKARNEFVVNHASLTRM